MEGVVMNGFAGRRVLVTGHTGFKGSWLSLWLLSLGARVTGFALAPNTQPALFDQLGLGMELDSRIGDVRDRERMVALVREVAPEIVFHLAAQPIVLTSYEDPAGTFDTNVMGTANLLEAVRLRGEPCAVVVITTDKVYENVGWEHRYREIDPLGGHDPYSASKAAAEMVTGAYRRSFLAAAGIRLATARAGNVIGGGDWSPHRIVPDLVRAIGRNEPVAVRNPHAVRPWQSVLEPIHGYLTLADALAGETGDTVADAFNFGPGNEADRSVRALVEAALAAWPEPAHGWVDAREPSAPHEARVLSLSVDRAHARLRWRPRLSFAETVKDTMAWYHASSGMPPVDLRDMSLQSIRRYERQRSEAA